MTPKPTGRLSLFGGRADLTLERQFKAPIEDVWSSVTDPESMKRWIGTWSGEAGPGKTVQFRMLFEQGDAVSSVLIERCDPPHELKVLAKDEHGTWHLELRFRSEGDTTILTFVQHLDDPKVAGDVGPGWEYYLDMLVAARSGSPQPTFSDYYPAQRDYYLEQAKLPDGA